VVNPPSNDKHAVAIAVEAVSLRDGVSICRKHSFARSEGRNQHEQRRVGQVEIGEHGADGFEFVTGQYKEVGFAGSRLKSAVSLNNVFERSRGGGADSHNPASFAARGIQAIGGGFGNLESFGFQNVLRRIVRAYGQERSDPDVQGDSDDLDSLRFQQLEHGIREVETRRRRSNRAGSRSVNRLILDGVCRCVASFDIRRQRNVAVGLQEVFNG